MKILFDQGTPVPLRRSLTGHTVLTAYEMGWSILKNGDLIQSAENESFDVFVTTDTNLKHQRNLSGRKIAIVVLLSASWPRIQSKMREILICINEIQCGGFIEIVV